ncbi:hypothetical protein [Actinomycetospora sp. CA-084318]|uniref:hypothetical protein n=1 Tax=Actinomycetospora sp. CA-084318 TaxID=3239892 RepID=UPI003D95C6AC
MEVEFRRRADDGSVAEIVRADGVHLRMRSYDVTNEVPHDAVHLIGERALGITDGLWGSIAAGALFASVEVVAGRQRHDRRRRSDEVRRRHDAWLRQAEVVVGTLQNCLDRDGAATHRELDRAWGITHTGRSPFTVEQAERAVRELRRLRTDWWALGVDAPGLRFTWPETRGRRA